MKALLLLVMMAFAQPRDAAKVYVPAGPSKTPMPLVVLLHGYMGNQEIIDSYFGFSDQVEKRKFVLIVPNGLTDDYGLRYWNASPACCDFNHRGSDDVGYLKSLITDALSRFSIDRQRIYVVGHSNGGFMAHRMACDLSELVTGIVSFAGVEQVGTCSPTRPVNVLQIHALDDETISFNGSQEGYPGLTGYPGAVQTVRDWVKRDGCRGQAVKGKDLDLASSIPGLDTTTESLSHCRETTTVEFWKIRRYQSDFHSPHSPWLTQDFTDHVLDFIFANSRR